MRVEYQITSKIFVIWLGETFGEAQRKRRENYYRI